MSSFLKVHSYITSGEHVLHVVRRYFVCVELFASNIIGITEITIERILLQSVALPALRVTVIASWKVRAKICLWKLRPSPSCVMEV